MNSENVVKTAKQIVGTIFLEENRKRVLSDTESQRDRKKRKLTLLVTTMKGWL